MDPQGNYTIQQWADPNQDFDGGLILEFYRNENSEIEMIYWAEDDLYYTFGQMRHYWDTEQFWDQVMIGYTDLIQQQLPDSIELNTNP